MPFSKDILNQEIRLLGEKGILSTEEIQRAINYKDITISAWKWSELFERVNRNITDLERDLMRLERIHADANSEWRHPLTKHSLLVEPFKEVKKGLLKADGAFRSSLSFLEREAKKGETSKTAARHEDLDSKIEIYHQLLEKHRELLKSCHNIIAACRTINRPNSDEQSHLVSSSNHSHVNYNSISATSGTAFVSAHVVESKWWHFSRLSALFKSCYPVNLQRKEKTALPNLETENASRSRLLGPASQPGRQP